MFSYYGAKTRGIAYYPKPKHTKIIEHFAGSGRYALQYFENDVLLIDSYEVIIKIWHYLQAASPGDIMALPLLEAGQNLNQFNFSCEGERLLMGFLVGAGSFTSLNICSPWGAKRLEKRRNEIAQNLYKIRHWKIVHADYTFAGDEVATHFIDPPYEFGGHKYKHSNQLLDYNHRGDWCRQLMGQTIVCENDKATWLPFLPMYAQRGMKFTSYETIWCNEPTSFDYKQLKLML